MDATQAAIDTALWTAALFWATLFLGVATLALGVAAIWGDVLKSMWLRPKLKVALQSSQGMVEGSARYYRLLVTNSARTPARECQVHLIRVERLDHGEHRTAWESEVPLQWMHADIKPTAALIGRDTKEICDLFLGARGAGLIVSPMVPSDSLRSATRCEMGAPAHMILTVQARSDEGASPPVRIEIEWDGGWVDDDKEMAKILRVTQLPA